MADESNTNDTTDAGTATEAAADTVTFTQEELLKFVNGITEKVNMLGDRLKLEIAADVLEAFAETIESAALAHRAPIGREIVLMVLEPVIALARMRVTSLRLQLDALS